MNNNLETGLRALPTISTSCVRELLRPIVQAEEAMAADKAAYEQAVRSLAHEIIADPAAGRFSDGWTTAEVLATDLALVPELVDEIRIITKR